MSHVLSRLMSSRVADERVFIDCVPLFEIFAQRAASAPLNRANKGPEQLGVM